MFDVVVCRFAPFWVRRCWTTSRCRRRPGKPEGESSSPRGPDSFAIAAELIDSGARTMNADPRQVEAIFLEAVEKR
jgi:hypothetical protein